MIRQVVYGFIYEMKQLILIMTYGTPNTNKFKSFIYKVILLENTETDWLNGIIRNTAISVLLNYLSCFWRSLEMSLINWKVELKCKWMSHCILSAVSTDNDDVHTMICSCSHFVSTRKSKTKKKTA